MKDRMRVLPGSGETSLEFDFTHGLVIFPGTGPDGERLVVELDTCASPNAVRVDLANSKGWPLGDEVEERGILSRCESGNREVEVPGLEIGELTVDNLFAHTDPLGGPAAPDILLGERFLREAVASVDFELRVVTFRSPEGWACPDGGNVFDLDLDLEGVPSLSGKVTVDDGIAVQTALLDTGFNGPLLLGPVIGREVGIEAGAPGVKTIEGRGFGGASELLMGKVRELCIGPTVLNDVMALCPAGEGDTPFPDPYWAVIGNQVFASLGTVTWALAHGKFTVGSPGP